jgi:hypothetical protein
VSPRYPQRSATAHLTPLALAQRFLLECLRARCVMEWVRERDLLIAQTLAFVQSVSDRERDGKLRDARKLDAWKLDARKLDARKSGAEPDRIPRVEAAPIDAVKFVEPPASTPFNIQAPRPTVSGEVRTEIQNRVASFRAHQQRFHREREAYCRATLARMRVAIGTDCAPPPLRK